MRNKISFSMKIAVVLVAFAGVVLSFFAAEADGYTHWSKRLLYFTSESNIWIGALMLILLILPYTRYKNSTRVKNSLYLLKYIFTVSITVTGFVFCAILAPGAGNDNYNAWTLSSIMTHVIVPTLSVADFFVDGYRISIKKRHIPLGAVPPLIYFIFASILVVLNVDFGRGDRFPYFFLNYYSPAKVFGMSDEMPYIIGSFYWIVFILALIIGISALYRVLYNRRKNKRRN
jgi:hypothetical protein